MLPPRFHYRRPAVAEQNEWHVTYDIHGEYVPDQRNLCHRAHAAAHRDKAGRAANQMLQTVIEMVGGDLFFEVTIRRSFELIHRDAEHMATRFMRPTAHCLHH